MVINSGMSALVLLANGKLVENNKTKSMMFSIHLPDEFSSVTAFTI